METQDLIDRVRVIAKEHGWAIGVHGSLKRDIDLIAVPWTEDACSWLDLWLHISKKVPLWRGGYQEKPHGRIGCTLLQIGSESIPGTQNFLPPQLDISFVRCNEEASVTTNARIPGLISALQSVITMAKDSATGNEPLDAEDFRSIARAAAHVLTDSEQP